MLNTESDDMPLLIDAIEAENDDDWIRPIETEDVIIPYKLDTGSQMDILPLKDFENIRAKKRIIKNTVKKAYNNQSIQCVGMTTLTLTLKHMTYKVMFAVVDTDNIALLGEKNTCIRLGLVKRIYAINSPGSKQLHGPGI